MDIIAFLHDKTLKPKEKTEALSQLLLEKTIGTDELIALAATAKDPIKATCIEALEFATQKQPDLITENAFQFVTGMLAAKAPRVKWESAKVIGNTAHLFAGQLDEAIKNLLINSEHEGTVVRWSAAFALGEILKQGSPYNQELLPAIEAIISREEKNSIKKVYQNALKKAPLKNHG